MKYSLYDSFFFVFLLLHWNKRNNYGSFCLRLNNEEEICREIFHKNICSEFCLGILMSLEKKKKRKNFMLRRTKKFYHVWFVILFVFNFFPRMTYDLCILDYFFLTKKKLLLRIKETWIIDLIETSTHLITLDLRLFLADRRRKWPEREEVRIASPFVGSGFILGPYQRRLLNLHHLLRVPPTTRAPSFPLLHPRELPRHVLVSLDPLLLLVHQEALHPSSATNESLFIHDLRGPRLLDLSRRDSGIYFGERLHYERYWLPNWPKLAIK